MSTVNNILNLKINSVSTSASINFGNTVNIGAESFTKQVGGSSPIGDFSRNLDQEKNLYLDSDLVDQSKEV